MDTLKTAKGKKRQRRGGDQLWLKFVIICGTAASWLLISGANATRRENADIISSRNNFPAVIVSNGVDTAGTVTAAPSPPRNISSTNNPVYFIHIGKSGGSSVDNLFGDLFARRNETIFLRRHTRSREFFGRLHFDWSLILSHNKSNDPNTNADVISFLRDPISRSASQFYFSKHLKWAKKSHASFLFQTFEEYLENPGNWRQPIEDGEGGVSFFSGCFNEGWVRTDQNDTDFKRGLRANMSANVLEAARNLDKTVWFGLLEDIPRSMKMLQISMGLPQPPTFPHKNKGGRKKARRKVKKMIESYIPGDLWFYEYAKLVFDARWKYVMGETKTYVHPRLPPFPLAGYSYNLANHNQSF